MRFEGVVQRSWTVLILLILSGGFTAESPAAAAPPTDRDFHPKGMGKFITALCRDRQGNLWVGTEDTGVWQYNPRAENSPRWTQFTRANTGGPPEPHGPTIAVEFANAKWLGDDYAYALACDKLGRIWVGHLNHGVSVFNGKQWCNYDVLTGPLGERVFDIATCPVDGDVWIATSAGLTRYRLDDDTWTHYTRADGLASDAVQCLAFDKRGTLYAGTQCHGLAVSEAAGDYRKWRRVIGSDSLPLAPAGRGLPSNLINDVLVASTGTIYVATTCGLAASKDGKSFYFLRGSDWTAKVKGLYGGAPKGWKETPARFLLLEDYCTCLAEDDAGQIWIGHRQKGFEVITPEGPVRRFKSSTGGKAAGGARKRKKSSADYAFSLLAASRDLQEKPLVGWYGYGLTEGPRLDARDAGTDRIEPNGSRPVIAIPPLPTPIQRPTLAHLNSLLKDLDQVSAQEERLPAAVSLPDDWRTQGTWTDRYGRYACVLCAMAGGGSSYGAGYHGYFFAYMPWIGPNHPDPNDGVRNWMHWRASSDLRVLQNPWDGGRRQSEWDDHKEAYYMALDGPDLYGTVRVPAGEYLVSCYLFNKDGHTRKNRFRDYVIEIRPTPMVTRERFEALQHRGANEAELFASQRIGASSRVRDFWGGVWKRFYIYVPTYDCFTVHVRSNYSFNTILSSIHLDRIGTKPYQDTYHDPFRTEPAPVTNLRPSQDAYRRFLEAGRKELGRGDLPPALYPEDAVLRLLYRVVALRDSRPRWYAARSRPYLLTLLRALVFKDESGTSFADILDPPADVSPAIAICLNDLGLFARRNGFYYGRDNYDSFRWFGRTQKGSAWEFDKDEFGTFNQQQMERFHWFW